MTLKEYLIENKLTYRAFAEEVGISYSAISRYVNGNRRPSLLTFKKIQRATNGKVDLEAFNDYKTK